MAEFLHVVTGMKAPQANEDSLRAVGDLYNAVANDLDQLTDLLHQLSNEILAGFEGLAASAFAAQIQDFLQGDYLGAGASSARELAKYAQDVANLVEYMKWMMIGVLVWLAAELAFLAATAEFNWSAPLEMALARLTAKFAINKIVLKVVSSIILGATFGIASSLAIDQIIQGIQRGQNHRSGNDWTLTLAAVEFGLIGGVVGGLLGPGADGLGNLLGKWLGKDFTDVLASDLGRLFTDLPKSEGKGLGDGLAAVLGHHAPDLLDKFAKKTFPDAGPKVTGKVTPSTKGRGVADLVRIDGPTLGRELVGGALEASEVTRVGFAGDLGNLWGKTAADRYVANEVRTFDRQAVQETYLAGSFGRFVGEMSAVFEDNLSSTLGRDVARELGSDYGIAFLRAWGRKDLNAVKSELAGVVSRYDHILGPGLTRSLSHDVPDILLNDLRRKLRGDLGYKAGGMASSMVAGGINMELTTGFYNLIFGPDHKFETDGAAFGAGALLGGLAHGGHTFVVKPIKTRHDLEHLPSPEELRQDRADAPAPDGRAGASEGAMTSDHSYLTLDPPVHDRASITPRQLGDLNTVTQLRTVQFQDRLAFHRHLAATVDPLRPVFERAVDDAEHYAQEHGLDLTSQAAPPRFTGKARSGAWNSFEAALASDYRAVWDEAGRRPDLGAGWERAVDARVADVRNQLILTAHEENAVASARTRFDEHLQTEGGRRELDLGPEPADRADAHWQALEPAVRESFRDTWSPDSSWRDRLESNQDLTVAPQDLERIIARVDSRVTESQERRRFDESVQATIDHVAREFTSDVLPIGMHLGAEQLSRIHDELPDRLYGRPEELFSQDLGRLVAAEVYRQNVAVRDVSSAYEQWAEDFSGGRALFQDVAAVHRGAPRDDYHIDNALTVEALHRVQQMYADRLRLLDAESMAVEGHTTTSGARTEGGRSARESGSGPSLYELERSGGVDGPRGRFSEIQLRELTDRARQLKDDLFQRFEDEVGMQAAARNAARRWAVLTGDDAAVAGLRKDTLDLLAEEYRRAAAFDYSAIVATGRMDVPWWLRHDATNENAFASTYQHVRPPPPPPPDLDAQGRTAQQATRDGLLNFLRAVDAAQTARAGEENLNSSRIEGPQASDAVVAVAARELDPLTESPAGLFRRRYLDLIGAVIGDDDTPIHILRPDETVDDVPQYERTHFFENIEAHYQVRANFAFQRYDEGNGPVTRLIFRAAITTGPGVTQDDVTAVVDGLNDIIETDINAHDPAWRFRTGPVGDLLSMRIRPLSPADLSGGHGAHVTPVLMHPTPPGGLGDSVKPVAQDQFTWFTGQSSAAYLHELLHYAGAREDYRDRTDPDTGAFAARSPRATSTGISGSAMGRFWLPSEFEQNEDGPRPMPPRPMILPSRAEVSATLLAGTQRDGTEPQYLFSIRGRAWTARLIAGVWQLGPRGVTEPVLAWHPDWTIVQVLGGQDAGNPIVADALVRMAELLRTVEPVSLNPLLLLTGHVEEALARRVARARPGAVAFAEEELAVIAGRLGEGTSVEVLPVSQLSPPLGFVRLAAEQPENTAPELLSITRYPAQSWTTTQQPQQGLALGVHQRVIAEIRGMLRQERELTSGTDGQWAVRLEQRLQGTFTPVALTAATTPITVTLRPPKGRTTKRRIEIAVTRSTIPSGSGTSSTDSEAAGGSTRADSELVQFSIDLTVHRGPRQRYRRISSVAFRRRVGGPTFADDTQTPLNRVIVPARIGFTADGRAVVPAGRAVERTGVHPLVKTWTQVEAPRKDIGVRDFAGRAQPWVDPTTGLNRRTSQLGHLRDPGARAGSGDSIMSNRSVMFRSVSSDRPRSADLVLQRIEERFGAAARQEALAAAYDSLPPDIWRSDIQALLRDVPPAVVIQAAEPGMTGPAHVLAPLIERSRVSAPGEEREAKSLLESLPPHEVAERVNLAWRMLSRSARRSWNVGRPVPRPPHPSSLLRPLRDYLSRAELVAAAGRPDTASLTGSEELFSEPDTLSHGADLRAETASLHSFASRVGYGASHEPDLRRQLLLGRTGREGHASSQSLPLTDPAPARPRPSSVPAAPRSTPDASRQNGKGKDPATDEDPLREVEARTTEENAALLREEAYRIVPVSDRSFRWQQLTEPGRIPHDVLALAAHRANGGTDDEFLDQQGVPLSAMAAATRSSRAATTLQNLPADRASNLINDAWRWLNVHGDRWLPAYQAFPAHTEAMTQWLTQRGRELGFLQAEEDPASPGQQRSFETESDTEELQPRWVRRTESSQSLERRYISLFTRLRRLRAGARSVRSAASSGTNTPQTGSLHGDDRDDSLSIVEGEPPLPLVVPSTRSTTGKPLASGTEQKSDPTLAIVPYFPRATGQLTATEVAGAQGLQDDAAHLIDLYGAHADPAQLAQLANTVTHELDSIFGQGRIFTVEATKNSRILPKALQQRLHFDIIVYAGSLEQGRALQEPNTQFRQELNPRSTQSISSSTSTTTGGGLPFGITLLSPIGVGGSVEFSLGVVSRITDKLEKIFSDQRSLRSTGGAQFPVELAFQLIVVPLGKPGRGLPAQRRMTSPGEATFLAPKDLLDITWTDGPEVWLTKAQSAEIATASSLSSEAAVDLHGLHQIRQNRLARFTSATSPGRESLEQVSMGTALQREMFSLLKGNYDDVSLIAAEGGRTMLKGNATVLSLRPLGVGSVANMRSANVIGQTLSSNKSLMIDLSAAIGPAFGTSVAPLSWIAVRLMGGFQYNWGSSSETAYTVQSREGYQINHPRALYLVRVRLDDFAYDAGHSTWIRLVPNGHEVHVVLSLSAHEAAQLGLPGVDSYTPMLKRLGPTEVERELAPWLSDGQEFNASLANLRLPRDLPDKLTRTIYEMIDDQGYADLLPRPAGSALQNSQSEGWQRYANERQIRLLTSLNALAALKRTQIELTKVEKASTTFITFDLLPVRGRVQHLGSWDKSLVRSITAITATYGNERNGSHHWSLLADLRTRFAVVSFGPAAAIKRNWDRGWSSTATGQQMTQSLWIGDPTTEVFDTEVTYTIVMKVTKRPNAVLKTLVPKSVVSFVVDVPKAPTSADPHRVLHEEARVVSTPAQLTVARALTRDPAVAVRLPWPTAGPLTRTDQPPEPAGTLLPRPAILDLAEPAPADHADRRTIVHTSRNAQLEAVVVDLVTKVSDPRLAFEHRHLITGAFGHAAVDGYFSTAGWHRRFGEVEVAARPALTNSEVIDVMTVGLYSQLMQTGGQQFGAGVSRGTATEYVAGLMGRSAPSGSFFSTTAAGRLRLAENHSQQFGFAGSLDLDAVQGANVVLFLVVSDVAWTIATAREAGRLLIRSDTPAARELTTLDIPRGAVRLLTERQVRRIPGNLLAGVDDLINGNETWLHRAGVEVADDPAGTWEPLPAPLALAPPPYLSGGRATSLGAGQPVEVPDLTFMLNRLIRKMGTEAASVFPADGADTLRNRAKVAERLERAGVFSNAQSMLDDGSVLKLRSYGTHATTALFKVSIETEPAEYVDMIVDGGDHELNTSASVTRGQRLTRQTRVAGSVSAGWGLVGPAGETLRPVVSVTPGGNISRTSDVALEGSETRRTTKMNWVVGHRAEFTLPIRRVVVSLELPNGKVFSVDNHPDPDAAAGAPDAVTVTVQPMAVELAASPLRVIDPGNPPDQAQMPSEEADFVQATYEKITVRGSVKNYLEDFLRQGYPMPAQSVPEWFVGAGPLRALLRNARSVQPNGLASNPFGLSDRVNLEVAASTESVRSWVGLAMRPTGFAMPRRRITVYAVIADLEARASGSEIRNMFDDPLGLDLPQMPRAVAAPSQTITHERGLHIGLSPGVAQADSRSGGGSGPRAVFGSSERNALSVGSALNRTARRSGPSGLFASTLKIVAVHQQKGGVAATVHALTLTNALGLRINADIAHAELGYVLAPDAQQPDSEIKVMQKAGETRQKALHAKLNLAVKLRSRLGGRPALTHQEEIDARVELLAAMRKYAKAEYDFRMAVHAWMTKKIVVDRNLDDTRGHQLFRKPKPLGGRDTATQSTIGSTRAPTMTGAVPADVPAADDRPLSQSSMSSVLSGSPSFSGPHERIRGRHEALTSVQETSSVGTGDTTPAPVVTDRPGGSRGIDGAAAVKAMDEKQSTGERMDVAAQIEAALRGDRPQREPLHRLREPPGR